MTPLEYLLLGCSALMAAGGWILLNAARHAVDGFEDEFGFHFGIAPPITSLYPLLGLSAYAPAEQTKAAVPPAPKRRRKAGSKPPMLPANLNVSDLNPRAASSSLSSKSEKSKASQTTQTPIPPVS